MEQFIPTHRILMYHPNIAPDSVTGPWGSIKVRKVVVPTSRGGEYIAFFDEHSYRGDDEYFVTSSYAPYYHYDAKLDKLSIVDQEAYIETFHTWVRPLDCDCEDVLNETNYSKLLESEKVIGQAVMAAIELNFKPELIAQMKAAHAKVMADYLESAKICGKYLYNVIS